MKTNFAWKTAGLSDVGIKREINEDSIYFNQDLGLIVLADGMGGHQGGEVASAMAITSIREELEKHASPGGTSPWSGMDPAQLHALISTSVSAANSNIVTAANMDARYLGMGTTVVIAINDGSRLLYGHVGDSRLYRLRNSELQQLSRDHSLVSELVAKGFYTEEEARKSTQKNVITRALGTADTVVVDLATSELLEGDRYLFCSDGLSDLCSHEEMLALLLANPEPHTCCQALVNAANANGGRDNVSVVLMDILPPPKEPGRLRKTLGWLLKH